MGELKMKELLETFTPFQIMLFLVLAAAAIRCIIEFFDWARGRLKVIFDKEHSANIKQQEIDRRFEATDDKVKELEENQTRILNTLNNLDNKVDLLIASDKDAIKSDITKDHHYYCYVQKWIDDYTYDCCLRRFKHYTAEGGNSFIEDLMDDLKELPKRPPEDADSSNSQHVTMDNNTVASNQA